MVLARSDWMVSTDHSSTITSCVSSSMMALENWRSLVIEAICIRVKLQWRIVVATVRYLLPSWLCKVSLLCNFQFILSLWVSWSSSCAVFFCCDLSFPVVLFWITLYLFWPVASPLVNLCIHGLAAFHEQLVSPNLSPFTWFLCSFPAVQCCIISK